MKIVKISEKGLLFDNGTSIEDLHEQDCCEHVYADWSQLEDTDVKSHDFNEQISIEKVEGSGFRIEGYFIPCYNEQNGYYGSDLSLEIKEKDKETRIINVDCCVEDRIE